MTQIFQYSLSVSIPLFILWVIYRWALASEKQVKANRFVLLSIYIVSLLLYPVMTSTNNIMAGESVFKQTIVLTYSPSLFVRFIYQLSYVWAAGAIIVLFFTLAETLKIYLLVRKAERVEVDGHVIYVADNDKLSPFSFGKIMVMNRNDFESCRMPIMNHELGHITNHHSLDIILAQIVAALCWYNPAAWLMRSELKSVHEYQADDYTLAAGCDAKSYQLFLIKKAVGSKFPSIGNNFNHSKLRNRISMMNRPANISLAHKLRYLFPLFGVMAGVLLLSIPEIKAAVTPVRNVESSTSKSKLGMDVYIDGIEIPYEKLNDVPANSIKSISINKNDNRIEISTEE